MWFTENAWPPMLICAVAGIVFLGLWNSDRRSLYLVLALVSLGMIGVVYGVERMIVTDGEKLQLQVVDLCNQFRRRDPAALDHFAASAPGLRLLCQEAMALVEVGDDLRLTDFKTTLTNQNSRGRVHFRANATISVMGFTGHHPFRCVLSFQKEGGNWRIIDVERLDPIKGEKIGVMDRR
ncbi:MULTISPECIES: hypothetical protein [unclassified Schlesneria]|uniref:hypothetical protein n=1 Tax=Schlesneria TaxID=656899 RepID=UPI002EF2D71C